MEHEEARWDDEAAKFHDLYRRYIQHEDDLINHRFTGMVTINAFLITTAGFCVQKQAELAGRVAPVALEAGAAQALVDLRWCILLLSALGFCVSTLSMLGIFAATAAIKNLDRKGGPLTRGGGLPPLTGGGVWAARFMGTTLTRGFPVALVVFWAVVLAYLAGSTFPSWWELLLRATREFGFWR